MKYATAAAFRAALDQRLPTVAREGDVSLPRLRRLVVFERLLARLLVVAPDRWVLKGGFALDLRLGDRARTTKDMDLARQDDEAAATADLLAAQAVDLGDYFVFAIERTGKLDALLEGAAVRYRVTAELAGRRFDGALLDVGFGDPPVPAPDYLPGPNLLGFAGFDPIAVPALPLEQHVAEKIHAYTRPYSGQRQSSRVKDLIDLVLIRSAAAFEAGRLRQAINTTFATRATHSPPTALPPPPQGWRQEYRTLANDVGLDTDVSSGHRLAAAFLDPVLGEDASDAVRWDPESGRWRTGEA
jgi:predicted nucleotidyltransferase component of viral defense system